MGDYAVRVFGSIESLLRLQRLSRTERPDIVLIDQGSVGPTAALNPVISGLSEVPIVLIGEHLAPPCDFELMTMPRPPDALWLSRAVDEILRTVGARTRAVRYRDVTLDFSRLECLVTNCEGPIALPLKEAQLLKLFLEKAGICLSRAEIQTVIWRNVKVTSRTIDSHVSRLRKRLRGAEAVIESVYGGGYILT